MAAAAPSRAEAAFRELLALHHSSSSGTTTMRTTTATACKRNNAATKQQKQQQHHHDETKPELTLPQQMHVLRDGASTAGARKAALAALRAWLEQRHGVRRLMREVMESSTVDADLTFFTGSARWGRGRRVPAHLPRELPARPQVLRGSLRGLPGAGPAGVQRLHPLRRRRGTEPPPSFRGRYIRCECVKATLIPDLHEPHPPLHTQALSMRLPAGLHHDPGAGLFVYDAAAHDAHKRGKAIPRQARTALRATNLTYS